MTVYELENQVGRGAFMTAAEYRDWQRFWIEEPWGCAVDDNRFTVLASVVKTSMAGGDGYTMDQLFPRNRERHQKVVEQDEAALSRQIMNVFRRVEAREQAKKPEETRQP